MEDNDEILEKAADWRGAGKGVALATVVTHLGLLAAAGRRQAGGRSGQQFPRLGLGRLRRRRGDRGGAQDRSRTASRGSLSFGVTNEQAWEVGLACGGKIQVFVERVE